MGDALRSYDHYRWAERYAKNRNDEKARAHMRRALHYGRSSFGTGKEPEKTDEAGKAENARFNISMTPIKLIAALRSEPAKQPLEISCTRVLGRLTTLEWLYFCIGVAGDSGAVPRGPDAEALAALHERARREVGEIYELVPRRFHDLLEISKLKLHIAKAAKSLLEELVDSVKKKEERNQEDLDALSNVVSGKKTYKPVIKLPLPFEQQEYGPVWLWDTRQLTSLDFALNNTVLVTRKDPNAIVDARLWDTSNVTSMVYTFQDCYKAVIGIERWNVGSVVNMNRAFSHCELNLDIGDWDTSQVTTMESMFWAARNFNQPIGRWDTRKVTNMESMFERATAFNQDISDWDTTKVDNMSGMFEGATSVDPSVVTRLSRRKRKLSDYDQEKKLMGSIAYKPSAYKPKSKFGASPSAFGAPNLVVRIRCVCTDFELARQVTAADVKAAFARLYPALAVGDISISKPIRWRGPCEVHFEWTKLPHGVEDNYDIPSLAIAKEVFGDHFKEENIRTIDIMQLS